MRTSDNTTPVFVDTLPDWSEGVRIEAAHATITNKSRAGMEQRARTRTTAKYRIVYMRRGYTVAQWRARWEALRIEQRSVCIVPFWNEGADGVRIPVSQVIAASEGDGIQAGFQTMISAGCHTFSLNVLRQQWFQAGRYAYLTNGEVGRFQLILSASNIKARGITSDAGGRIKNAATSFLVTRRADRRLILRPAADDAVPEWTECRIFPCVPCRRLLDSEIQTGMSAENLDESITFETL